ncbi:hypothetical protein QJS04_geneDACA023286 [Acorus gramineus]|uniref:Uncharacterized protein n=1 Tax=Acorus gramineus TaxID=55184 RepID=A0AAV9BR90_ACOGR|nr:hypothetical protein QJS04_geneDACA023286 [Acorus gramineus]
MKRRGEKNVNPCNVRADEVVRSLTPDDGERWLLFGGPKKEIKQKNIPLNYWKGDEKDEEEPAPVKPKKSGLGIRRLKDWNTGAQGVRFWDLASHNSSLWSTWVKRRYLKKANIWSHSLPMSCTNAWKRIMHTKAWIMGCVRCVIFEGKSINDWHEPWLNGRGIRATLRRELLIWGPPLSTNLSVPIQIGKWTKPIRWHTALDPLWDEIQQLEVGGTGPNILIWPLSLSGKLNYQDA